MSLNRTFSKMAQRAATGEPSTTERVTVDDGPTNGSNGLAGPAQVVDVSDLPLNVSHINGGLVIRAQKAGTAVIDAAPITDRERQVLSLVAEGFSNKLISAELGISERTVKNHLTTTMTKLRASDRTHAVVTAVRLGWLEI